jgi:hypothetical protein
MSDRDSDKRSGYLFVVAGGMMLLASLLARQLVFCGPGALFLVLGAGKLRQAP